jgi:hypothetical protein
VDHVGGLVHHGPTIRSGSALTRARPPAAPEHGGLPAVVGEGEESTGSSFRTSLGLRGWCGVAHRMGWLNTGSHR